MSQNNFIHSLISFIQSNGTILFGLISLIPSAIRLFQKKLKNRKSKTIPKRVLTYRITGTAAIQRLIPLLPDVSPDIEWVEATEDSEKVQMAFDISIY